MDPDDIELLRSATPAPRASTWEKAHARVAHEVAHEAAHGRVATHRPPRRARQLLAGVTILLAAAAATIAAIFATASSPPPLPTVRACLHFGQGSRSTANRHTCQPLRSKAA